jgi:hypothetical protein
MCMPVTKCPLTTNLKILRQNNRNSFSTLRVVIERSVPMA